MITLGALIISGEYSLGLEGTYVLTTLIDIFIVIGAIEIFR